MHSEEPILPKFDLPTLKKTGYKSGRTSQRSTTSYKKTTSQTYVKFIPLEKDIQKSILQYLDAIGVFAWRNNTGGGFNTNPNGKKYFIKFSTKGAPDILGCLKGGAFLAIEVKRPGGVATKNQLEFLATVSRLGGLAFIATSVDEVEAKLKQWQESMT